MKHKHFIEVSNICLIITLIVIYHTRGYHTVKSILMNARTYSRSRNVRFASIHDVDVETSGGKRHQNWRQNVKKRHAECDRHLGKINGH